MEKVIVIIEDDLYKLEEMLLNIQSILFIAAKKSLSNAPKENDTEICVLHIIDKDELSEEDRFNRYKLTLEKRQQDLSENFSVPELKLSYNPIQIDKQDDVDNYKNVKRVVTRAINKKTKNKDYALMLDLILDYSKDKTRLNEKKILSHFLYEQYKDNCLLYTLFGDDSPEVIKIWMEKANMTEEPLNRRHIMGNAIYKKFKEALYTKLNIGGEGNE